MHFSHARHERGEGADEWHETRQHDGDAAIALVERMGLLEGTAVEPPRVRPLEHLGPEIPSDGVVALVSEHGRHQQHGAGNGKAHQPGTAQRAHDEEQGIAGQEGHDDDARFHEHDGKEQRIDPGAIRGHEGRDVLVHVQDEIDEELDGFQGGSFRSSRAKKRSRCAQAGAFAPREKRAPVGAARNSNRTAYNAAR